MTLQKTPTLSMAPPTTIPFRGGSLAARVTRPAATSIPVTVLLTHGASGDCDSGRLPAYADRLAAAGLASVRFTCASSSLPTRAAAFRAAAAFAQSHLDARAAVVYGGHSMGARAAVVAAGEEGPLPVAAVFLSSFPLHPPGKPAAATSADRGGLLQNLVVPAIALRGSKDPFSTQPAWDEAVAAATSAGTNLSVFTIDGGDHSLKKGKEPGAAKGKESDVDEAIEHAVAAVADAARAWVEKNGGETTRKRKR